MSAKNSATIMPCQSDAGASGTDQVVWVCGLCKLHNNGTQRVCNACGSSREQSGQSLAPVVGGVVAGNVLAAVPVLTGIPVEASSLPEIGKKSAVEEWLDTFGRGNLAAAFAAEGYDTLESCSLMDWDDDLAGLEGMKKGYKNILLAQVEALKAKLTPQPLPGGPSSLSNPPYQLVKPAVTATPMAMTMPGVKPVASNMVNACWYGGHGGGESKNETIAVFVPVSQQGGKAVFDAMPSAPPMQGISDLYSAHDQVHTPL